MRRATGTPRRAVLVLAVLCAAPWGARAADPLRVQRESWLHGTAEGWQDRDTGGMSVTWGAVSFDGSSLVGTFGEQGGEVMPEVDAFVAGPAGSDGVFAGDFYTNGLVPLFLSVDVCTPSDMPSSVLVRLRGGGGGPPHEFWTSVTDRLGELQPWTSIRLPLQFDPAVWNGGSGAEFTNLLRNVTAILVQVTRRGAHEQAVALDNVEVVWRVPAAVAAVDSDGDGLPDYWEEQYYGGPTNAVPWKDDDGDGIRNEAELWSGTDPREPRSVLAVHGMLHGVDEVYTVFKSEYGIRYGLEGTASLADSNGWSEVGPVVDGSGGYLPLAVTNAVPHLFLRVKAWTP